MRGFTIFHSSTKYITNSLIYYKIGFLAASKKAPIFPTTPTSRTRAGSSTMPSSSQDIITTTSYKPTTKVTTTQVSTTSARGGATRGSKGFQFNTVLIGVIAGSVFTFLCMVVACLILTRIRKQRREMEMERSMSDKGRPANQLHNYA